MGDSPDQSYYEVALTNRQVLMAFVLLLLSVLASFLSGVWVGKSGAAPSREGAVATVEQPPNEEIQELEDFKFFSEEPLAAAPSVASGEAAPADRRGQPSPPAEGTTDAGRGAADRPPPPSSPAPARESPAAADPSDEPGRGWIIQVFSTKDRPQAADVIERLERGGYSSYMSPVEVAEQTMFRVRVGPYANRAEAEAARVELSRRFKLDTWVTRADS